MIVNSVPIQYGAIVRHRDGRNGEVVALGSRRDGAQKQKLVVYVCKRTPSGRVTKKTPRLHTEEWPRRQLERIVQQPEEVK